MASTACFLRACGMPREEEDSKWKSECVGDLVFVFKRQPGGGVHELSVISTAPTCRHCRWALRNVRHRMEQPLWSCKVALCRDHRFGCVQPGVRERAASWGVQGIYGWLTARCSRFFCADMDMPNQMSQSDKCLHSDPRDTEEKMVGKNTTTTRTHLPPLMRVNEAGKALHHLLRVLVLFYPL